MKMHSMGSDSPPFAAIDLAPHYAMQYMQPMPVVHEAALWKCIVIDIIEHRLATFVTVWKPIALRLDLSIHESPTLRDKN